MIIEEMHIDFGLKLQKIDAKIFENFRPLEIDWILNDTIKKYVESNLIPKRELRLEATMQSTKARYDNIEELVTTVNLKTYRHDDNTVFVVLPSNYFKLIDDISTTSPTCDKPKEITETESQDAYTTWYVPKDKYNNNYKLVEIIGNETGGPITLYDATTRPHSVAGISEDLRYRFIEDVLMTVVNFPNISIYWEKYGDVYANNSFIFVTTNDTYGTISINWDNSINPVDVLKLRTLNHVDISSNVSTIGNYSNRLVKSEYITNYLNNSLLTTKAHTPISNLEGGKLFVNHLGKFLPSNVKLIYIRKANKVDIERQINCDLNVNVHEKIVDLAVKRVDATIKSGNLAQLKEISKTVD